MSARWFGCCTQYAALRLTLFCLADNPLSACRRVLIFSQMVRVLDIVSDYMRLKGLQHQRLDGSTPAQARHQVRNFSRYTSDACKLLLEGSSLGRPARHPQQSVFIIQLGIRLAASITVSKAHTEAAWSPLPSVRGLLMRRVVPLLLHTFCFAAATTGSRR